MRQRLLEVGEKEEAIDEDLDAIHEGGCAHVLQRTAAHCNTLQHTATRCNILQRKAAHYNTPAIHCNILQDTASHCNTLQHKSYVA